MKALAQLYRALLKESNKLPNVYLSRFFRLRYREQCRKVSDSTENQFSKRMNSLLRDLKGMKSANAGDRQHFLKLLNYAYGRVGPLRWALLKPLLTDSEQPAQRLIPNVIRSTLPVYHSLLKELLTNATSRRTKPLKKADLINPPLLPDRAIHRDSDEARLLGPFSKRREINIRWRFFSKEIRKVYPPVEVSRKGWEPQPQSTHDFSAYGFQERMMLHMTELSGPNHTPTIPRREKERFMSSPMANGSDDSTGSVINGEKTGSRPSLPTRWLRRRYRELLHSVPLVSQGRAKGNELVYNVKMSDNALGQATKATMARIGKAKLDDLEWIMRTPSSSGEK